jgi:beta-glucuronidase
MLSPRESTTRERITLDGLWRFAFDAEGRGRTGRWWAGALPGAAEVPVPASFNAVLPGPEANDHIGDVWYQRIVRVPRGWDGQRIVLRFDAATHRAVVWVDDEQVAEHEGGYTPFEADVTAHVRAGGVARVTTVVNTELRWDSIPPGFVDELEDGRRLQQYFHDFFNYTGLHRSVWLHATPRTHISDVTVTTTGVDGDAASIGYDVAVTGEAGHTVRVLVREAAGAEVARGDGASGTRHIEDVRLWRPGAGHLYTLEVALLDVGGEVVDVYPQPFGVRTVAVDGHRFLINGELFHFTGFGKHEDFPVHGRGYDAAVMVHDFELLRWIGANSFRSSHYPYDEAFLDYADRHGVVVIDETAAVGLNLDTGAGILNQAEPLETYSDATIDARTRDTHRRAHRPRQEPSLRGDLEPRQRARHGFAGRPGVLRAARRRDEATGPHPAGRLRQLHVGHARARPDFRPLRRAPAQPLLRLVRVHGRSGRGRTRARSRTARVGAARQADRDGRVRRRHADRTAQPDKRTMERGVPGRPADDVPPRLRPDRRGRRRAHLELRRLRHPLGHLPG